MDAIRTTLLELERLTPSGALTELKRILLLRLDELQSHTLTAPAVSLSDGDH
jgi:hypothetical protein